MTSFYGIIPVRNDSREFPGKAKFPGILEISQEILGNFAFFWCDRKFLRIPGNFWEHLQQYLTAFRGFSRILENSQDLTEMCENQILNSFKRTGSQEFPRIPRNDLTYRF